MGNRRLYGARSFKIESVDQINNDPNKGELLWHLVGRFTEGSIRSKYGDTQYRIRVKPDPRFLGIDPRFLGLSTVAFRVERIYESESIGYVSRRHIYGSGKWYIAPFHEGPRHEARGVFEFEDFEVSWRE